MTTKTEWEGWAGVGEMLKRLWCWLTLEHIDATDVEFHEGAIRCTHCKALLVSKAEVDELRKHICRQDER